MNGYKQKCGLLARDQTIKDEIKMEQHFQLEQIDEIVAICLLPKHKHKHWTIENWYA